MDRNGFSYFIKISRAILPVGLVDRPYCSWDCLSKINRIVRFFSQRPQVQERLTRQILVALQVLLSTEDVAVHIDATHYCVKSRGVMDSNSRTSTTALGGCFKEDRNRRSEFLNI